MNYKTTVLVPGVEHVCQLRIHCCRCNDSCKETKPKLHSFWEYNLFLDFYNNQCNMFGRKNTMYCTFKEHIYILSLLELLSKIRFPISIYIYTDV